MMHTEVKKEEEMAKVEEEELSGALMTRIKIEKTFKMRFVPSGIRRRLQETNKSSNSEYKRGNNSNSNSSRRCQNPNAAPATI